MFKIIAVAAAIFTQSACTSQGNGRAVSSDPANERSERAALRFQIQEMKDGPAVGTIMLDSETGRAGLRSCRLPTVAKPIWNFPTASPSQ